MSPVVAVHAVVKIILVAILIFKINITMAVIAYNILRETGVHKNLFI